MVRYIDMGIRKGSCPKFVENAIRYEGDDCLLWPYGKGADGYGVIMLKGKTTRVSRVVCEAVHGAPPSARHEVAHGCNVPACVNPAHLRWDTSAGNKADKLIHDTEIFGERNGMAKLTAEQVLAIRASSEPSIDLATRFGIAYSTVNMIRRKAIWGWL